MATKETPFQPERYKKAQLQAALHAAGSPQKVKATKADLIVAFGQLKRGPRSTALNSLLRAGATGKSAASAPTTPETKKSGTRQAASGSGKARIRIAGATRAIYGSEWSVDADGVLRFVRINGSVQTFDTTEVEEVLLDESGDLAAAIA